MSEPTYLWARGRDGQTLLVGDGVRLEPERAALLGERAAAVGSIRRDEGPAGGPSEDMVVVRRTAAWVWGLDVLPPGVRERDWPVDLLSPAELGCARGDPGGHITEWSGVPVTTPERTALDCARWLERLPAVAALDQFLRRGVLVHDLRAMARTLDGYRRSDRLRAVLRLGDSGAESPGESWTRVTLVDAGLPLPTTQIPVMGPSGQSLFVDMGYEPYRVGVEYDGEAHHTGPHARRHDERRRAWLRNHAGWEIIVVRKDIRFDPVPYVEALMTALLHRGWNPDARQAEAVARYVERARRRRRRPHI